MTTPMQARSSSTRSRPIQVMIIDDSALIRQTLSKLVDSIPGPQVMATAADPYFAVQKLRKAVPDVITLDIEMPRMDGLSFLEKLMKQHPIPVVVISSLSAKGTANAIRALELGAVEVLLKPRLDTEDARKTAQAQLAEVLTTAAKARPRKRSAQSTHVTERHSADAVIKRRKTNQAMLQTTEKVVAIGASTGGTEAISQVLQALPHDSPGIVIVQHMPAYFTSAFAERLNGMCRINVKEARSNDSVLRGQALIAPGDRHLLVCRSGARYYVQLDDGQPVNRHRPSVDVLFRSCANFCGPNAVGILLTGMGNDGAAGLLEMRENGARTAAQDEASSIIYGMPKVAHELGAAEQSIGLDSVANYIFKHA